MPRLRGLALSSGPSSVGRRRRRVVDVVSCRRVVAAVSRRYQWSSSASVVVVVGVDVAAVVSFLVSGRSLVTVVISVADGVVFVIPAPVVGRPQSSSRRPSVVVGVGRPRLQWTALPPLGGGEGAGGGSAAAVSGTMGGGRFGRAARHLS